MPLALLGLIRHPLAKWVVGALVVIGLTWLAIHKFNDYKSGLIEQGRQTGRAEVTKEFADVVAENNRVNRAVEQQVDVALAAFSGKLQSTLDRVRSESATISGSVIKKIEARPEVYRNPVCETPQDTIDARNDIRALGPSIAEGTIRYPNGTISIPVPPASKVGE